ncbi:hypothetical protein PsAD5_02515 [Pseudovibrio sp. Ad5]|uniref:hypothetical protein n=1 Tax=Pseudovibrio sp. Ad5 TaxID=989436 RepID=UPI0007AEADA9|nr:hypothetical protein [Pseudovibrio sp. Ad5]KZK96328.1 hypothetical protein PsAD5_02515 [Pseudovibrio sp. Ad5]
MTTPAEIAATLARLGGWPEYFGEDECKHGEGMLSLQIRNKWIDEGVFGLVVRYAVHRAEYDRLSDVIATRRDEEGDEEDKGKGSDYLSGSEQQRAYHKRELLTLERELLVTPSAKNKADLSLQTSFLEQLDVSIDEKSDGGKVVPWKPLSKKRRG